MQISVFGLGYVGAVSMACLARDGHKLVGVDVDENKLALIRSGSAPIVEAGIQELMKKVVDEGAVTVTDNYAQAIAETQVSFVCVGTPSANNGSQNLNAITRLSEQMGDALKDKPDYHVVVIRSTVEPGTVNTHIKPIIEQRSGKKAGEGFGLCFQPEFLREGSSIKDYDNPPFTVIGTDNDPRSADLLRELFAPLPGEFMVTSVGTAECVKYACNAFHALKVTFANEIGRIAQALDVDSHEVMKIVCEDKQLNISKAYLRPGFAFGGSCLPKDLKALLYLARREDVQVPMLGALLPSNQNHIEHAIDRVLAEGRPKVGMIGLSFKSGTDDLRESPLVIMAERFIGKGLPLKIFDPEVNVSRLMGANRAYIEGSIPHIGELMCDNMNELMDHADVIVVGLSDKALIDALMAQNTAQQLVLDLVGIDPKGLRGRYLGACW